MKDIIDKIYASIDLLIENAQRNLDDPAHLVPYIEGLQEAKEAVKTTYETNNFWQYQGAGMYAAIGCDMLAMIKNETNAEHTSA